MLSVYQSMFLTQIFWRKCVQIYIADIQHFTLNINKVIIILHIHKYLILSSFFCRLKARFSNRMLLMLGYPKLWIDSALLISGSHKFTLGAIVVLWFFFGDINKQFSGCEYFICESKSSTATMNIYIYYFLSISYHSI